MCSDRCPLVKQLTRPSRTEPLASSGSVVQFGPSTFSRAGSAPRLKRYFGLGTGISVSSKSKTPLSGEASKSCSHHSNFSDPNPHLTPTKVTPTVPPKSPPPFLPFNGHLLFPPNQQPTHQPPSRDLPQANIKNKPHTAIRHHTPSHSIRITAAAEPLGARVFLYPYSFSAATAATLERGRAQPRCKKIPSNSDIDNKQRFSRESPSSQSAET